MERTPGHGCPFVFKGIMSQLPEGSKIVLGKFHAMIALSDGMRREFIFTRHDGGWHMRQCDTCRYVREHSLERCVEKWDRMHVQGMLTKHCE